MAQTRDRKAEYAAYYQANKAEIGARRRPYLAAYPGTLQGIVDEYDRASFGMWA